MMKTECQNLSRINYESLGEIIELQRNKQEVDKVLEKHRKDCSYFHDSFKEAELFLEEFTLR